MLYEEESLPECMYHAIRGKRMYERLVAQYGEVPVFLCPYTGTGDIYLIGTFWKQYIEKENIKDYIFIVISKACEKTAKLFDIKNIVRLENKIESSYLIRYDMLCPAQKKITILNDSWGQVHTNPLEWFRGYKGLEFMQLFRKFVFDLPDHVQPEHPVLADRDKEEALPLIRRFYDMGFNIEATIGTALFLKEHQIRTRIRRKLSEGSEEILDSIRAGYVSYVINTRAILSGIHYEDGAAIRQCATQNHVTMLTNLDTVKVLLDVLEEVTIGISRIDEEERACLKK